MKIIVIGGVAAGASTATKLKRINGKDEVILIERGEFVSFANCGLPYFIGGDIDKREKLIVQKPKYFNQRYGIDVMINTNVISIDRINKNISIENEDGERSISYDKLVIATGGTPFTPPIEGVENNNVFKLWTIPDMDKIDDFIKKNNPKTATVVGGGFIGIEMVEALTHRGIKVSLIENAEHIMPNIDFEYASMIKFILEGNGIEVLDNLSLSSIQKDKVVLSNGRNLESDMTLLSVGVKPNNELAVECGIEIGKTGGIIVDEYMQTNDDNIYACGDVVELNRSLDGEKVRVPLAGPASKQARIVAKNINGEKEKYNGTTGASVVKIFDYTMAFVGLSKENSKNFNPNMATVHRAIHPSYYPNGHNISISLVYDKKGTILGAQAFGKKDIEKRIDIISQAIFNNTKAEDLVDIDLSYSPPYNSPNDPINYLGMISENDLNGVCNLINFDDIDLENGILIDVREIVERKQGKVNSSISIPLYEIENRLSEFPKDKNIYIHCATGMRSYLAIRKLLLNGFDYDKLYNVSGGFMTIKNTKSYKY